MTLTWWQSLQSRDSRPIRLASQRTSPRAVSHNGYRDREWDTRAGDVGVA